MIHSEKYSAIVKWYDKKKGYGFLLFDTKGIEENAPNFVKEILNGKTKTKVYESIAQVYFHITGVKTEETLQENDEVFFQFQKGKQGPLAVNIEFSE